MLGLWMKMGPFDLIMSAFKSIIRMQTISVLLVVLLIMTMSRIMEESGHMARLVTNFARLSKDARTVASVMSALIGLLPMPGGALFSAPMVEASLSNVSANAERKTALNYWFRHIWEYWWPLYPGVILAVALLEVETWLFMVVMIPMTPVSIIAGILFILIPMGKAGVNHKGCLSWPGIKLFMWEMMPILIVIFFIVFLTGMVGVFELIGLRIKIIPLLTVLPGLVASVIWVCYVNNTPFLRFRSAIISKDNLFMLFLLVSIMIFKGIMEDSQAVACVRDEMMAYGIPVILLALIMPFLSGFILGIAVGFVGASFPLIIPLFHTPDLLDYLSFAALAYTFGYIGMMLSPVHLCFLVTKDFFKASLLGSYRHIIIPALMVISVAVFLFFIVRIF